MCSNYIINGVYVSNGRELVAVIGTEAAKRVNPNIVPDRLSEDDWLNYCLCHVNQAALSQITGKEFVYDGDEDAFVPA